MKALNKWLNSLALKEKTMLFAVLLIFFPLISYFFYASDLEDEVARKEASIKKDRKSLASYQKKSDESALKSIQEKVKKQNDKLIHIEKEVKISKDTLLEDKKLTLSEKNWAHILELILDKSIKNDVTITELNINSSNIPYIGNISFIKTLKINGFGEYLHVESMLRFIESLDKYFKLESAKITQNGVEIPKFEATFNLLGVVE